MLSPPEPWTLGHSSHRPEKVAISEVCLLGQRGVLCDAPLPKASLPFKAHLPSSVSGKGQRGGDKKEPQVGKKETEKKNSKSLVRVKEKG